jgi:hypothetical protein
MKDIRKVTQINIYSWETDNYMDSISIYPDTFSNEELMKEEINRVENLYDEPYNYTKIQELVECTNCFNRWDGNAQCDCTVDSDTEEEPEKEQKEKEVSDEWDGEPEIEMQEKNENGVVEFSQILKKQRIEGPQKEIMETLFKKYWDKFEEIKNEHPVNDLTPEQRAKLMLWVADKIANSVFLKYVKLKMQ